MIRAILSLLGFIFSWLTLGVVAIALGVGAILWVYARGLPDHEQLANYTPPTISRIYSSEGRLIDEFARERRLFVPAADIPDRVKHAFIAAEDQNFYTHQGYDPRGIAAALRDAIVTRGETLRGASTITQQVMKNFLLSGDRTGERKVKEIILAARIEQTLSKDDILELYLNEIFLGQNSFGVAAAARTYFNKTLEELTIPEAAYLAALPKAPSDYHPVRQHEAALDRRAYVLGRMFEDGYITEFEYLTASAAPLETVQSGEIESARASRPPRDHFTDEIRRQFTETLRGDLPGIESEEDFFTGGLSIRATMDPVLQDVAAAALREGLESYDRGRGRWHGVRATLEPEQLADEAAWRDALSGTVFPRDIAGWQVAVILGFDGADALVGSKAPTALRPTGSPPTMSPGRAPTVWTNWSIAATSSMSRRSATRMARCSTGRCARYPGSGRVHGDGRAHRPRAGHAGRVFLAGVVVQPCHPGRPPTRLGVQAVRLCRRARFGLFARDHRRRRADRGGHRRRHLAAEERLEPLLRPGALAHRHRTVAQPDDGPAGPRSGHADRRTLCRAVWRL
ncbi:MAG: transglycosylase domain-containing protein [Rhodobacteraceae bacterium]|nr:transglycosylase domain-containing protein [Paracoccaceae bacterium]